MNCRSHRRRFGAFSCLFACLTLILVFLTSFRALAQADTPTATPEPVAILSPLPNQAIQGIVPIHIRMDIQDAQEAELSFSYTGDRTGTWFLISQVSAPVEGKLAEWDTTTLTDGNYTLRLIVLRQDGSQLVALAANLRVRNYTPVETDTPTPTPTPAPGETPVPTPTPTSSPTPIHPTPTPLPPNPLQLSFQDFTSGVWKGAVGAVAFFALLGFYASMRRILRRSG